MLQVKLSNLGRLPSSFKVKAEPHAAFKLDLADVNSASTSALQTLQPSNDTVLRLTFSPPDAASYSHEVMPRGVHDAPWVHHADLQPEPCMLGTASNDSCIEACPPCAET